MNRYCRTETVLLLASALCGVFMLSGCRARYSAADYMEDQMKKIIEAADENDADKLTELFADAVVSENAELREEAEAFAAAVDGEFVSVDFDGYSVYESSDSDAAVRKEIDGGCTVETTAGKYYMVYTDVMKGEEAYVGLHSLGVQSYEDYENEPCNANGFDGITVTTPENHGLIRLTGTVSTPEQLKERLADACARFGLTEADYESLPAEERDEVLRYELLFSTLQNRYDQKFCSAEVLTADLLDEEVNALVVYPEGGDPEQDCFTAYWDEENNRFMDDYQYSVISKLVNELLADAVSDCVPGAEVKVFSDIQDTMFAGTKVDITAADIPGNVTADCTIFMDGTGLEDADPEELCEQVKQSVNTEGVSGSYRFVILTSGSIDEVTAENYTDYPDSAYASYTEAFDAEQ